MTLPPLVFVAEVVLVLGLAAIAAAVYLGLPASSFRAQLVAAARPYLRHQGEIAHGLGMSVRGWALIRVGAHGAASTSEGLRSPLAPHSPACPPSAG